MTQKKKGNWSVHFETLAKHCRDLCDSRTRQVGHFYKENEQKKGAN